MSGLADEFDRVLAEDAARRARVAPAAAPTPPPAEAADTAALRLRLVGAWPREARPAFDAIRSRLAPHGFTLTPLHPGTDLRIAGMQTVLCRTTPGEPAQFAPLMFELDPASGLMRVYVRQFGGRAALDFPERSLDVAAPVDQDNVIGLLEAYVVCMLRPLEWAA